MTRDLKEKFPTLESPLIWLDFWAYAQRLFLKGGEAPWLSPSEFDGFYRQALGLLDPAVAPIDLDRLIAAHLARHPHMKGAMTARARTSFPLKTLLGDAGLRVAVTALCDATADARRKRPLALTIASPLHLLDMAHRFAHGRPLPQTSEDDCERAAVYLTDFLGSLGQPPGAFVLLVDRDGEAASPTYRHALGPLSNLARHMRWHLALATRAAITDPMSADLVFTPTGLDGVWSTTGLDAEPVATALYVEIPADADPETVLARLRLHRGH